MKTQLVIRYQTRPDAADLNEALISGRRTSSTPSTGSTTTRRSSTSSARPRAQMR